MDIGGQANVPYTHQPDFDPLVLVEDAFLILPLLAPALSLLRGTDRPYKV
jgi:hypothetical protein